MANRFTKWLHRNCNRTSDRVRMVASTPPTNEQLAKSILEKNNVCPIHFINKTPKEWGGRGFFSYYCPECVKETTLRNKMEEEKAQAAKKIENDFAISILKGKVDATNS